jgi:acetolactate synthase regulatory subunit
VAKARYAFPIDFAKLPRKGAWLGKIAETPVNAYFNWIDLTTHLISAGATGSGKTVSAMVIAEEALKSKIPVIVFDPTAQWTGFVRACKSKRILKLYRRFGLRREDARAFRGMIYEITKPKPHLDFKKFLTPGEITIFCLNKLKPREFDVAIAHIIDLFFKQTWEESEELKALIIFDEVHRLLEKWGGKYGYKALERACREFRKWGLGLIMISQVLGDFKEAVKGNVLTELQMHTKGLEDLQRVATKYGEEFSRYVTKLMVGVGMLQNPKYNKGMPYFVAFRPPLHSPHKLPEAQIRLYLNFAARLEKLERVIRSLRRRGIDTTDLELEFKLAMDKLKVGQFRLVKIYVETLEKRLERYR